MVEDADSQRALGGDWRSGKNQFFDNVEARVAGQVAAGFVLFAIFYEANTTL